MTQTPPVSTRSILFGAIVGIFIGFALTQLTSDSSLYAPIMYISNLIASVFIALLKMILVPLVFCAIAVGVAQLAGNHNMSATWKAALGYFSLTSLIAITLGLIGVNLVQPGVGVDMSAILGDSNASLVSAMPLGEFVTKLITNIFTNPIAAMADGNIMAVVIFAIFVGIAIIKMGSQLTQVKSLLEELFALMMTLIDWIMRLAPIGIAALLVKLVATASPEMLLNLVKFVALVIGLTLAHGLIVLPFLLWAVTGRNPITFLSQARLPLITAFSTSSSAATLPITLNTVQNRFNVRPEIARFVAPLGSQINMDGTAMYEAVAALFIAQLMGIDLSLGQQLVIVMMSMLASVGAPGIPSAGMVTMAMVLQSVGLPIEAIGILLPIDRILDAFRTGVNVEGDMIGCVIVDKLSKDKA